MRRLAQNRSDLWSPSPSNITRQRHAMQSCDKMINPIAPTRSGVSIRRQAASTAEIWSLREARYRIAAPRKMRLTMAGTLRLRKANNAPIGGLRAASPVSERQFCGPSVLVEHFQGVQPVVD